MRRWGEGLMRLSVRPRAGKGRPFTEEVVALVRDLVEGTTLSQKQIAARTGVSSMCVSRWARAGGWRRPPGSPRAFDSASPRPRTRARLDARTSWRRLDEAERMLAVLEAGKGVDLVRMEKAMVLLQEARALHRPGARAQVGRAGCS